MVWPIHLMKNYGDMNLSGQLSKLNTRKMKVFHQNDAKLIWILGITGNDLK